MKLLCRILGHKPGRVEQGWSADSVFCTRCQSLMSVTPHPPRSPFANREELTSFVDLKQEEELEERTHPEQNTSYSTAFTRKFTPCTDPDIVILEGGTGGRPISPTTWSKAVKSWDDLKPQPLVVYVERYGRTRWAVRASWSTKRHAIKDTKEEAVAIARQVAKNRAKSCRVKVAGQKGYLKNE